MALSTTELDALRAVVGADPGAPEFRDLASALLKNGDVRDAVAVLEAGLVRHSEDERAWALLARASLASGNPARALVAIEYLSPKYRVSLAVERLRIVALERVGIVQAAVDAAEAYLEQRPEDTVVRSVLGRLWRPSGTLTASDPHISVRQAESYVDAGDVERAVRVYRRVGRHHPDHRSVHARLLCLEQQCAHQQGAP